jgi:2-polyprenyl-3-methyl-5-hydroxy-6-metoxy-1,4-benzoquinol methylase
MLPNRNDRDNHVCPVERAGILDHRIRRWLQNPQKILRSYIEEGMTVLDIGCGPGFFSIDAAQMVLSLHQFNNVFCNLFSDRSWEPKENDSQRFLTMGID